MKRLFALVMVLVIAIAVAARLPAPAAPTHAQDDDALRQRVLDSLIEVAYYPTTLDSFILTSSQTNSAVVTLHLTLQDQTRDTTQSQSTAMIETHFYRANDDNPNVLSNISVIRNELSVEGEESLGFSDNTNFELRLVDGVLYAYAEVLESEGTTYTLPEGWVILTDDITSIETYSSLRELFDVESAASEINFGFFNFANTEVSGTWFEVYLNLIETSTSISSTETTGPDGDPIEIVTVDIDPDALLDELLRTSAPDSDAFVDFFRTIFADNITTLVVTLDAEGRAIGFTISFNGSTTTDDMSILGLPPEAMGTLSLEYAYESSAIVTSINADFPQAQAPTDATPIE